MKVIIKTTNGIDLAEPITDKELKKLLKANRAKHLDGVIYKEIKPQKKYTTKVQTAE